MATITVYSTQTCPYCHQIKQYLTQRGVPFRDADVSQDQAAAAEMVRVSGQRGVPVTVIDGKVVVGFDRPLLDELIAAASRPKLGAAVADAMSMALKGVTEHSQGAYVGQVRDDSVAGRAGLQVGDVIVSFAKHDVGSAIQLEQLVARVQPGTRIPLRYVRQGAQHETVLAFDA